MVMHTLFLRKKLKLSFKKCKYFFVRINIIGLKKTCSLQPHNHLVKLQNVFMHGSISDNIIAII